MSSEALIAAAAFKGQKTLPLQIPSDYAVQSPIGAYISPLSKLSHVHMWTNKVPELSAASPAEDEYVLEQFYLIMLDMGEPSSSPQVETVLLDKVTSTMKEWKAQGHGSKDI
ncbi:hypothetical protein AJ79_07420 [Helicocarpus griseus UAMH5409]|uniref:Uncharacterized protein n=1 Tax=Helicocarpus griseus UAMH5409 TaxID=1447875 RepID=A0A2B7X2S1_9EURO|nr:hypothetical protein AJ79_07420 [Helicocarpus griseus UAMH5409]